MSLPSLQKKVNVGAERRRRKAMYKNEKLMIVSMCVVPVSYTHLTLPTSDLV